MSKQVHIRTSVLSERIDCSYLGEKEGEEVEKEVCRVTCPIDVIDNSRTTTKEVWFEVDCEYKAGLCNDLSDPYVIGLLMFCLRGGYDIT